MCSTPDDAKSYWTYAEWVVDSGCTKRFVHQDFEKYMTGTVASNTSVLGYQGGIATKTRLKGDLHMHFFAENKHEGGPGCRSMAHSTVVEPISIITYSGSLI